MAATAATGGGGRAGQGGTYRRGSFPITHSGLKNARQDDFLPKKARREPFLQRLW